MRRSGIVVHHFLATLSLALTVAAATASGGGCGGGPGATMRGDGVNCGGRACPATFTCCADFSAGLPLYSCAAACPNTTVAVTCDGPEDCDPNGAAFCCDQHTLQTAPPGASSCVEAGTISCQASCVHAESFAGCSGSGIARLCRAPADCEGDVAFPNCCAVELSPWSYCVGDTTRDQITANGGSCD